MQRSMRKFLVWKCGTDTAREKAREEVATWPKEAARILYDRIWQGACMLDTERKLYDVPVHIAAKDGDGNVQVFTFVTRMMPEVTVTKVNAKKPLAELLQGTEKWGL